MEKLNYYKSLRKFSNYKLKAEQHKQQFKQSKLTILLNNCHIYKQQLKAFIYNYMYNH